MQRFLQNSRHYIDGQIAATVKKTLGKKLTATKLEAALQHDRTSLKESMLNAKRIKDTVGKHTILLLRKKYELEDDCQFGQLSYNMRSRAKATAAADSEANIDH